MILKRVHVFFIGKTQTTMHDFLVPSISQSVPYVLTHVQTKLIYRLNRNNLEMTTPNFMTTTPKSLSP